MNYRCDKCGAFLDPGERCDCQEERYHKLERFLAFVREAEDGQIEMNLEVCGVKDL